MKHISILLSVGAIFICAPLFSGNKVVGVHEASNAAGKIIGVTESQTRAVAPSYTRWAWDQDGQLTDKPQRTVPRNYRLPVSNDPAVSYGTSVSRNEFGITGGIFPAPCGDRIAVYRKDESRVSEFPLLDITSRTGSLRSIRYPMNGMASEHVSLCVCDTLGNILSTLRAEDFSDERYLTCVSWTPDSRNILVQVVSRSQHDMNLNMYSSADGSFVKTILSEHNDAWVEPQVPLHFTDDSHFIYTTDNRDGYKSLYLSDFDGNLTRLTTDAADVAYVATAATKGGFWLYYTSAVVSPVENHLFRVKVSMGKKKTTVGKAEQLTQGNGWHSVSLNPSCTEFIDSWSSLNNPGQVDLRSCDGRLIRNLSKAENPLSGYAQCEVELGSVPSADGRFDNYYRLFKPLNFDPEKKYPLIVYVYGGPHSQMVKNSWLGGIRMWEMVMAQRGYVVYVQDNRGTSNRGTEFEKAINRQCGQAEMADQIAGINDLLERSPWIDRDRVGVHGWSYGGFMTISLFTNYPELFKVAVAGGPVIDWKWYEIMYGERYMDNPETNPEGFEKTSLMNMTDKVHGKLLICQGAIDNTVVWQHCLSFTQKCIMEGKQLDFFPYPCDEHNMVGKARFHLYKKITDYFETWL